MPRSIATVRARTPPGRTAWAVLLLVAATALSGCLEEDNQAQLAFSAAAVADAAATNPVTPTTPSANSSSQNRAPTISGTPIQALNYSSSYDFVPNSSDADSDLLAFSIANKPGWAVFNSSTGRLSGTPGLANLGTYANVVITVSDGNSNVSLAPFSISVTQVSNGSATLSWMPPTENTDGSQLTTLSGYRIYYGTSADALTQTVEISQAGLASFVVDNLSPATWYFAIKALAGGAESDFSAIRSKTIS